MLEEEHEHLLFATATLVDDDDGDDVVIVVVLANDILIKVDKMEKHFRINFLHHHRRVSSSLFSLRATHARGIIKTNAAYRE